MTNFVLYNNDFQMLYHLYMFWEDNILLPWNIPYKSSIIKPPGAYLISETQEDTLGTKFSSLIGSEILSYLP